MECDIVRKYGEVGGQAGDRVGLCRRPVYRVLSEDVVGVMENVAVG